MSKVCLLVDTYGGFGYLVKEFQSRGFKCPHLVASENREERALKTVKKSDFDDWKVFRGDFDEIVAWAKRWNVGSIVIGMDDGIYVADELKHRLNVPGNDPKTSILRRNKFEMVEAVRKAGLYATPQIKSGDLTTILKWARQHKKWPLVVKPVEAAGTYCVSVCENETELTSAVHKITKNTNPYKLQMSEVVVQQFIGGDEFIFDSVSWKGHHFVTDIWKYQKIRKNDGTIIHGCTDLLPYDGPEQEQLIRYGLEVLKAVGFDYGPAHTELKLCDQGPALIEVNPRFAGAQVPLQVAACANLPPIDALVESIVNPDRFLEICRTKYELKKSGSRVAISAWEEGLELDRDSIEEIKTLESFFDVSFNQPFGTTVPKTVDVLTQSASVRLVHPDPQVVMKDRNRLMENVKLGRYFRKSRSQQKAS